MQRGVNGTLVMRVEPIRYNLDDVPREQEASPMIASDMPILIEPIQSDRWAGQKRDPRITGSLIGSSAMHLVAAVLLVFGLPWLKEAPLQVPPSMPVSLVQLAEQTASPPEPLMAQVPQTMATEASDTPHPEAVPVAQTPPPLTAERKAEERSAPVLLEAKKSDRKQEDAKPVKGPKPDLVPAARLQAPPQPENDLSAQLKRLAQLRQPPAPMPPNPRQQEETGFSNLTATSANAVSAPSATYSVKDFIRAQVERRWNYDRTKVTGGDWVVNIHIVLAPDGRVIRAEIVDDNPRFASDSAYRDFAFSARNAVLLSSPLTLPPDEYDIAQDFVVDFNSRQVFQ